MRLNLSLIFTGMIFFINPNFNLFDFIPDFIGVIMIMTGLSKIYMFNGDFESARKSAKYLLWISLLRVALSLWYPSMNKDYILPLSLILCVLEAIFMISMFKSLYLGLDYTLMRAGNDSEKLTRKTHEAFTMAFIFTLGTKLLEFAPNICELLRQDAELDLSSGASFKMSMAQMKIYVLGVCIICTFLLGLIFIFVTAKTWIRVIRDKNYCNFLKENFDSYKERYRDEFVAAKIEKVYFLLTASFPFLFDFYFDGINVLPTTIAVLLLFSVSLYLSNFSGTKKSVIFSIAIPACLASVINYLYMLKVNTGINYLSLISALGGQNFYLLEKKDCIIYAGAFSLLESILVAGLYIFVFMQMRKVFANEKRRVALPMLKLVQVPVFVSIIATCTRNVFRTIEGHLASIDSVTAYVQSKDSIISEPEYRVFMSNPLVARYEDMRSVAYWAAICSAAFALICVLYMIRIRRFTDKID